VPDVRGAVDAVVFDLGGVLVDWDPRQAFTEVLAAAEIEPFLDEIDFPGWNRGLDAGRPIADAEADIEARFPHRAGLIAAYRSNFRSTLVGEVPGTADIVRELATTDLRLLALTNWSAESFPNALELYPVLGQFEAIVVSGQERLVKPDPRIFQVLLERHGLTPERTAFIDDAPANVEAARVAGLRAVRFTDATALRRDLVALGLPLSGRP
jgi:2-haloacid dehalogenase